MTVPKHTLKNMGVHVTDDGDNVVHFSYRVDGDVVLDLNRIVTQVSIGMATALDVVKKAEPKKRAAKKKEEVADEVPAETADAADAEPAKPKARRSRKAASKSDVSDTDATDTAQPDAGSDAEPAGAASGGRRRRRSASAEPSASGDAGAGTAKPAGGRRRRSAKAADVPSEGGGDDAQAEDISDADLTSAASRAAAKIMPKAVQDIIEEFGVEDMRNLDQAQRVEFIERMAKEAA